MKMEQKQTKLSGATLFSYIFAEAKTNTKTLKNKNGSRYCHKEIYTEYGRDTEQCRYCP
jgi:hypothetical protein